MEAPHGPNLLYIGDPMCSWCWGFAPVLERLVAAHDLELRIVVGGLRPGPAAQPLTERLRSFLLHHWDQVAAASGQPFDRDALIARPPTWKYDTELPARAVVTIRAMAPHLELPLFFSLQEAFYARGDDITDPGLYPGLVTDLGVSAEEFSRRLAAERSRRAAHEDFATARRLGVTGFPTTLLAAGGRYRMLAAGYRPFAEVDAILHAAVDRLVPDGARLGPVCAPH